MSQLPPPEDGEAAPLALVRYGLAKEIRLYPDALTFIEREDGEVNRFILASIRRISLQPGEKIPSKLVLLVELEDSTTVIAAEGMTNVRDFRRLLPRLRELAPAIEFEPADLDDQLLQAVTNRRQANLGCYATVLVSFGLVALLCVIGNLVRTLGH
ncbi:MAG: hypothetical protein H0X24_19830 [Ktedonobacterales bacterium]|nr:hypothetical protein [Ktedonobacterales bacterium]